MAMRDIQRLRSGAGVLSQHDYHPGLWGGAYLHSAFGLNSIEIGKVLMVMPVAASSAHSVTARLTSCSTPASSPCSQAWYLWAACSSR